MSDVALQEQALNLAKFTDPLWARAGSASPRMKHPHHCSFTEPILFVLVNPIGGSQEFLPGHFPIGLSKRGIDANASDLCACTFDPSCLLGMQLHALSSVLYVVLNSCFA